MSELYKIIGLRDVEDSMREEFMKAAESGGSPEIDEIRKGYHNPLIVANILKCRAKCLEEL